ncbi:hypothetical protein [Saccharothrix hoggarensis]|uniref:Polyketide cyclase/dehydrase/lipid transport protein n=1 Tax=Saccharothrix hoggarensis TaxID=913853 RepID=A0ABW3R5N1_9PSEU
MATGPVESAEGVVGVAYAHFYVESRGLREPPRFVFDDDDGFLAVMDDVVALHATSDVIRSANVRIEAWDRLPEVGGPGEAEVAEGTVALSDGAVRARAVPATAPDIDTVPVGPAGWYHVRAFRWGADVDGRVEHFLLQLWPSGEPAAADRSRPAEPDELTAWNRQIRQWADAQGFRGSGGRGGHD